MQKNEIIIKDKKVRDALYESLHFLHVGELKALCCRLDLSEKGPKVRLIERIMIFVTQGCRQDEPVIPRVSCIQKGKEYPLARTTLILKGSYKNDLKTRLFFKSIIGDHFHFTAFGIDWINARWFAGNPPTYQEFADMWITESEKRVLEGSVPKKEWAYINFTQKFIAQVPKASRHELLHAWETERRHNKAFIEILFATIA